MKGANVKVSEQVDMVRRIEQHGRELLRVFPNAIEQDPLKLCKRLRRIEAMGAAFALRLCNGPEWPSEEAQDADGGKILRKVHKLLNPVGTAARALFLNRDPRGYALKIDAEWTKANAPSLHRDWGGYGIIAPDLTND